ncbi:MAG TPA: bifunctional glutamate N-acetyltransferase/amino-acid acetyltransferase ArgJ [Spirochaetota bacterium]|nr:bifunctional glutamate N-acetyltransferase/amino-acid acetyltransferase ArgJ [Spirochaetota bacterium]HPR36818.1 bifunctional glutamate N-acetyltransferase/amino-acid acetyltransferase ArgJ [Spirochaetota bacterium]
MKEITGGLENVKGYKFSAIKCGIRYTNKIDYSIIVSDTLSNASGVFTTNKISAAPVKICRERINNGIKAILINSTNANACTGDEGYQNTITLTTDIADRLKCSRDNILMASTGIIGRQLPSGKMMSAHDELLDSLSAENGATIAEAIMTTDTFPKQAAASFEIKGQEFCIAGVAKGSGMIAPNMATLLSFIITDAPVDKKILDTVFKKLIKKTFNAITIDGDMSTNDTAIILSPAAEKYYNSEPELSDFFKALEFVMTRLAELLIEDGEGATKGVKIYVKGAATDDDASLISRAVSESLLVKTAIFGNDPNWGRIACAAGYSGADIDEEKLSIYLDDKPLFLKGKPTDIDYSSLEESLKKRNYTIKIDIGLGTGESIMFTTDISYDYVKINAQYST